MRNQPRLENSLGSINIILHTSFNYICGVTFVAMATTTATLATASTDPLAMTNSELYALLIRNIIRYNQCELNIFQSISGFIAIMTIIYWLLNELFKSHPIKH